MGNILILGDDGINSLGVLRSLGEKGYKPDLMITSNSKSNIFILKSKYYKSYQIVDKNEKAVYNKLVDYGKKNKGAYIFPTSDFVLNVLSCYRDDLTEMFIFPSVAVEDGSLSDLMRKTKMAEYAEKAGFCVPKTMKYLVKDSYGTDRNLFKFFSNNYPLILKSESIDLPGCDFLIVKNENELKDSLAQCIGSTIMIQQFIQNAEEVAIQGVAYGDNQEPIVCGIVKKIRTSVFALGTTTYANLEMIKDDDLKKMCLSFMKTIGFSGLFDIEILVKNKKYYFIECNLRNGSYGYAFTRMGANLPELWLKGMNAPKGTFLPATNKNLKDITFVNDIGDFAHVIKKNISPFKWLAQYISADARLTYNFKDPKPFYSEIVYEISKNIKNH